MVLKMVFVGSVLTAAIGAAAAPAYAIQAKSSSQSSRIRPAARNFDDFDRGRRFDNFDRGRDFDRLRFNNFDRGPARAATGRTSAIAAFGAAATAVQVISAIE